jgi:hypothetical protein
MFDRLVVIDLGRMIAAGLPTEVRVDPKVSVASAWYVARSRASFRDQATAEA